MSHANLILYAASLPSYRSPKDEDGKDKGKKEQEEIDAGDPRNKDKVRAFLDSIE